jgi:SAM-dependent methyltransferase
MAAGRNDWLHVAREASDDELRERILTGFKDGKPFTPYRPTIALPAGLKSILDFGCGLGRNFPFLKELGARIAGFDLPPMIARCRELAPVQADELSFEWASVRTRRFDLVFATLVLQHVEPDACRAYLDDFARIAPAVYLLTRVDSDFDTKVLDDVVAVKAFEPGVCVQVDHDPDTHQLRVLGQGTFDDVRATGQPGEHYELLLNVKA